MEDEEEGPVLAEPADHLVDACLEVLERDIFTLPKQIMLVKEK